MIRCLIALVLLGSVSLMGTLPGIVSAQEEEEDYSWGIVSSVTSSQIIVKEYDYDQDKDLEVSYAMSPNVKFEGVASLKDIKPNDDIEIDYVVKDGKRLARVITVSREPEGAEEEYAPVESYEEESE